MKALAPLLLAMLAAAPAASAADTATLAFESWGSALLVVDDTRSEAESEQLRGVADTMGDRDGTVSDMEAANALTFLRSAVRQEVERQVRGGNLTLDGKAPLTVSLKTVTASNLTGPVDQPSLIRAHAEATLLFEADAGAAAHTLFARVRPKAGEYLTTIQPPPGFQVAEASAGVTRGDDGRSATFTLAPDSQGITLRFEAVPEAPSPAGGLGLALWAVGGALALRRGRLR